MFYSHAPRHSREIAGYGVAHFFLNSLNAAHAACAEARRSAA